MLKKICTSCNFISNSLDDNNCSNCDGELVDYLMENKGINKLKSSFSKNRQKEKAFVGDLERLKRWKDFFEEVDQLNTNREFYSNCKIFKEDISNFNLPEMMVIENNQYNVYFSSFNKSKMLIDDLDKRVENVNSLMLDEISRQEFLNYLNSGDFSLENKIDYVGDVLVRIKQAFDVNDIVYLNFYDESLNLNLNELNDVIDLSHEVNDEIQEMFDLSKYFADFKKYFSGFAKKPLNYVTFKQKIFSFSYLDIAEFFEPNFKDLFYDIKDFKVKFWELDNENSKVKELEGQIKLLNEDFGNVLDGIVDDYKKHQFLDKYSSLKEDIDSFKYLFLLKDADDVIGAQEFFNNFDKKWEELAFKKAQMEKEEKFNQEFKKFSDKWNYLLNLRDIDESLLYSEINDFNRDLDDLKLEYGEFLTDDSLNKFDVIFNYEKLLNNKINSIDFDTFKVSYLLNYLKDSSLDDLSKMEKVNEYRQTLNQINSNNLEGFLEFDENLKISFKDIDEVQKLFDDVDLEISNIGLFNNDYLDDITGFKSKVSEFNYLDILPYFDESVKDSVYRLLDGVRLLKQVDIEVNKISSIILDCTRFKIEYENKKSKEVLDKYDYLRDDVSSFNHLELLPSIDSNLKDFVEVVSEVQEIFEKN